MKKFILISGFLFLLLYSGFSQNDFKKLNSTDLKEANLDRVTKLLEKIMDGQKNENYYLLSEDEASAEMVKAFTRKVQMETYHSLRPSLGDYSSLEFVEAWSFGSNIIFRFRGTFNESELKPEIRAVYNEENKLGGFWIKPWKNDIGSKL